MLHGWMEIDGLDPGGVGAAQQRREVGAVVGEERDADRRGDGEAVALDGRRLRELRDGPLGDPRGAGCVDVGDQDHELVAVELTKAKWTHAEVFKYTACNHVNNYLRMGKVNTRGSIDHLKASIKNQMVLLGMICPNGKPLAFCTYGECLQFGGWYAKLAAGKDPALKVQETEEELRKLQTWQE